MKFNAVPFLSLLALCGLTACQNTKPEAVVRKPDRPTAKLTLSLMEAFPPHETAAFPVAGGLAPERGKMVMVPESELNQALETVGTWDGGGSMLTLPPLVTSHGDVGRSELSSPAVYGPAGAPPPKEGVRWIAWLQIDEAAGTIKVRSDLRLTESLGLADPHTPVPAGTKPEYSAHIIEASVNLEFNEGEAAVFCVGTSSEGHPVWGVMRAERVTEIKEKAAAET